MYPVHVLLLMVLGFQLLFWSDVYLRTVQGQLQRKTSHLQNFEVVVRFFLLTLLASMKVSIVYRVKERNAHPIWGWPSLVYSLAPNRRIVA